MIQTLRDTAGKLNYAKTSNKNNSYAYLYTYKKSYCKYQEI